jgi:GNAT superfamily N-acetyltransferase
MRVRDAGPADIETLVAFNAAMAEETEDLVLDEQVLRRGVTRLVRDRGLGRCLVAETDEDGVLGTLSVTQEWSDWRCGLFWWIQSVYVVPEARGRGVFTELYDRVRTLGRQTPDVIGLRLYVERNNVRAQRAYARLGMEETAYRIFEVEFAGDGSDV